MVVGSRKVSIVDIAKMAGVSIATVSRVLNQRGRYSRETEKKILKLVEQYNYTPNATAQTLRTNRSLTIGVVVPDITNEFFAKIVRVIEDRILPEGYSVFICDTHENEETENLHIQSLKAKNVDGLIYISGKTDSHAHPGLPVVYIDRHPPSARTIIESDNVRGGFLAAEELIKKGCKRIALLQDYRKLSTVRQRRKGYEKAHQQYGLSLDPELTLNDAPNYQKAKECVAEALNRGLDFDGIFATTDTMALGAYHALREAGKKVPTQVKIVGFDDISLAKFCDVPLTTITQDTDAIGRLAVERLLDQMQGDTGVRQSITVPVTLNRRAST